MYWYDHGGMNGWGYTLVVLITLAIWGLLAIAALALLRLPSQGARRPGASAEQLLAERFARGEIDEDDYHQRLAVLRYGIGAEPRKSG